MNAIFSSLFGKYGASRILTVGAATFLVIMLSATACGPTRPTPSSSYSTGNRLVIPVVSGAVTIDGLASEASWSSGFRFVMEDGGSLPAATFRGFADASFIYFYAEVEDNGFEASDVVVIGLNPDNASGNYRRIHVFPCNPTGTCPANGNGIVPQTLYYAGSLSGSTYTWTAQPLGPSGIQAATATATAGSVKKWSVEVKIPRGAPFNFVDTNFFGLFFDVVRSDPLAGIAGEAVQYTWPPNRFIGSMSENDVLAELETGTLLPAQWGNATLSAAFGNGVSIGSNDIGSNHPTDPNLISINNPNIFHGTATNNTSSGGTLVGAQAVTATFRIANFGLPSLGSFALVPVSGNPTAAADIPPASAHTFTTGTWNLTLQQKTDYTANEHQCIRVELSSTNPSTVFVNTTAMRNMTFTTASSPFKERALLSVKGIERPQDRTTLGYTLREVFYNFDPRLTWKTEIRNATRVSERLYRAETKPGADHQLEIVVEPPRVKIPSATVNVPPGTGGSGRPPIRLNVRPGELVTLIAKGTLLIDGQPVTATGAALRERQGKEGARRIGVVRGSLDGGKTWFAVGNAATLKVPSGAQALELRIDDDPDGYSKHRGEGFVYQVIATPIEPWMRAANPDVAREVRGADVLVPLGSNLPTWLLRGERDTGRFIRIDKKTFRVYESVGSFGYMVQSIK